MRSNAKNLKTFIRRSIRAANPLPDEDTLANLLSSFETPELQMFWSEFTADRSFSATNSVPYWKTREQSRVLKSEGYRWMFFPKEKDSSGKNIIVRADLEEHIRTHILVHIAEARLSREAFSRRPFIEKIHVYLGITIVFSLFAAVPISIFVLFFTDRATAGELERFGIMAFASAWTLYLIMPLTFRPIRWLFHSVRRAQ